MTVRNTDYAWVDEGGWELEEAYCLTLIKNLRPKEVIERMGGTPHPQMMLTLEGVIEAASELDEADGHLIALTTIGEWVLMVEPNGFQGVRRDILTALSQNTIVVSHYRSVNGDNEFVFARNGIIVVAFEPSSPGHREGEEPDWLNDAMLDVGFDMGDEDEHSVWDLSPSTAAFALAEKITGIRLSRAVIDGATYACARVPLMRA